MNSELNLLLLEDDPSDADLIQKLLKRSGIGFKAVVASDEDEFLKALDQHTFDAVLADNALPQYSSVEALKIIKEKNPFTAFILVTGTVSEEFAVNIIKQGADDYILKTNLTRLPSAISKTVESKKIQREKKSAENEMQELNEQLRNLAAHLQNVREEEQTRISREIHDELGQMLTAIKMDITSADKKIRNHSLDEASAALARVLTMVDNTVKTIRRIASELRPSILDDLGLIEALEWQSMEFERRNAIKCSFTSNVTEISIDRDNAIGLYRIFQEALTNIMRHSGASEVNASLQVHDNVLELSIRDNGKGFDPEKAKAKKSLGLVGMKERAIMMKGELTTETKEMHGTTVRVRVPLAI
jgi:two-component system, NarL family, sensor histidine kinase UhpB